MPSINSDQKIYTFAVTFLPGRSVSRTFSIPASYQLINLHRAIHEAIDWYGDAELHLFGLDRTFSDLPSVILCPDYEDFDYTPFYAFDEDADYYADDDDDDDDDYSNVPPLTDQYTLADLKPSIGQKFQYLFNAEARYRFEIELIGITTPTHSGNPIYPHIIDRWGEMPPQFDDEEYL